MAERTGVFISYATRDGAAFAAGLRSALESEGVFVWQDVIQLPRVVGQDWWKRITDGIDHVNYLIMVLTPAAFERETVLQEWRHARRTGVCVIPVKAAPEIDIQALPRWMKKVQFAHLGYTPTLEAFRAHDDGQAWKGLIGQIFAPCEKPDYAFMVDKNDVYVPRAALSGQVIEGLLDREQKAPRAITSALRGAGGFGKTTLARAICFDDAVQDAFSDGILWVTLGESATMDTVRVKLNALIEAKTHQRSDRDFESAKTRLRELLDGQEVLIVIDDVWKREHAEPFLRLGDHLTYLITTRMEDVLPHTAQRIPIAGMALAEAAALIGYGFSDEDKQAHAAELRTLAERLGEYALLLKLANGTLHDRVRAGEPLAKALDYVKRALAKRGITKALEIENSEDRNRAVHASLSLSLERLNDKRREWFKRLAIFPEDAVIPFATLEKAWGCDDLDVEDGCAALNRLSLALDYDLNSRTITLHDIVRAYLREQVIESTDALKAANTAFLDAYGVTNWRDLPADEPYLWDNLAYHLLEAESGEELITTALDLCYLAVKTFGHGTQTVEADIIAAAKYARENSHTQADALRLLERNYRNMAHILTRCASAHDTLVTLHTRLSHFGVLRFACDEVEAELKPPYITKWHDLPDLPHPALMRTFISRNPSRRVAFGADNGSFAAHSDNWATCIWDTESGQERCVLKGQMANMTNNIFSPDGRSIVSGSGLNVRIWDSESGRELLTLIGHTRPVSSAAFSPDGTAIVSASYDNTLKVWDATDGTLRLDLQRDNDGGWFDNAAWSPDGRLIVSESTDGMLTLWDAATGRQRLQRREFPFSGFNIHLPTNGIFSPDGRFIICSSDDDRPVIIDIATNIEQTLGREQATHTVSAAFSPDGQLIASMSSDNTVSIWDATTGDIKYKFLGNAHDHSGIIWSPSGRWVLASLSNHSLILLDVLTGDDSLVLRGYTDRINNAVFSCDGSLLASASADGTIKVWDLRNLSTTFAMTGHGNKVKTISYSPNGESVASASADNSLKVWNAERGDEQLTIRSRGRVDCASYSPDGTVIALGGSDKTRAFDAHTGMERLELFESMGSAMTLAFNPDGTLIVSASLDSGGVKVHDSVSGAILHELRGHQLSVASTSFSRDGQWILSASRDGTLKVWETITGHELHSLQISWAHVPFAVFGPEKQLLVTTWDNRAEIKDAVTGRSTLTLAGHSAWVNSASFSADGTRIISASADKTLKVWNAVSGACLATFYTDAPLTCCAWSPDGKHIVAGGEGGYLYWLRWVE